MHGRMFVLSSYVSALTIRVARQPVAGETLIGGDFNWGPGGKGFNQAIAAARLGANVDLAVAIGRDSFGEIALETLTRERISTDLVYQLSDIQSGVGFVTLDQVGENTIVIALGANERMTPSLLESAVPRMTAANLFLTQLELPVETVAWAIGLAKSGGAMCVLNPAPARPLPPAIFESIDLLTPNEPELRILNDLPPDDATPTLELARRLRDRGVKRLVVTRGGDGALVIDEEGVLEVPALKLLPVDVTGAGDTFNACLAAGLLMGLSLREAARRAVIAGGYCTQHLGVINGLPTLEQLQLFARNHGHEIY